MKRALSIFANPRSGQTDDAGFFVAHTVSELWNWSELDLRMKGVSPTRWSTIRRLIDACQFPGTRRRRKLRAVNRLAKFWTPIPRSRRVRQDELYALWQTLGSLGLATPNQGLITDIVCCPGLDYCVLANARSIPISQRISERFADIKLQQKIGSLRINISGCINACGHHHNADIGILGVDKKGEEFFQLTFGGCAEEDAAIGQIIGTALPEGEAVNAISRVIDTYLARRVSNERFRERHGRKRLTASPSPISPPYSNRPSSQAFAERYDLACRGIPDRG